MLKRMLKATERSLSLSALRVAVRTGALVAPARVVEFVAHRFFMTTKPTSQQFSIVAPVRGQLRVPDGEVVTYRWGAVDRDPTVVLVHGWSGWSQQMERFVAPLQARGFAVLAFDHVAHGASAGNRSSLPVMIRTVEHVLRSVPQAAGVIAHSLGAGAAAAILASSRRDLSAAVLIAPPSDPRPYLARLAMMLGAPRRLLQSIQRSAERIAGVEFERLTAQSWELQKIRTPLLIVHDVDDAEVPISDGYAYTSASQVRVLATDGLGHRRILRDLHVVDTAAAFVARSGPLPTKPSRDVSVLERTPYAAHRAALLPAS